MSESLIVEHHKQFDEASGYYDLNLRLNRRLLRSWVLWVTLPTAKPIGALKGRMFTPFGRRVGEELAKEFPQPICEEVYFETRRLFLEGFPDITPSQEDRVMTAIQRAARMV